MWCFCFSHSFESLKGRNISHLSFSLSPVHAPDPNPREVLHKSLWELLMNAKGVGIFMLKDEKDARGCSKFLTVNHSQSGKKKIYFCSAVVSVISLELVFVSSPCSWRSFVCSTTVLCWTATTNGSSRALQTEISRSNPEEQNQIRESGRR